MNAQHVFRFARWLGGGPFEPHGIAFHRWLPDGTKDALRLKTAEPTAEVRFWCERFGKMDGKFIKFAHGEKSFDSAAIPRQGMLDGGPLYGDLRCDLNDDESSRLAAGGELAAPIGKRILRLIELPGVRLVNVIRRQLGQHWLADWTPWDSRRESLQSALLGIQLEWKGPGGAWADWQPVSVGQSVSMIDALAPSAKDFMEFASEGDWRAVERIVNGVDRSAAVDYVAMAHENLYGNVRLSLIDCVTACELALSECIRVDSEFSSRLGGFWNLPLPTQLVTAIAAKRPELENGMLTNALLAIDLRNRIIHEGWSPDDRRIARIAVLGMVGTVGALLAVAPLKFPRLAGNWVRPVEEWESDFVR